MKSIQNNQKTIRSIDMDTICPKKLTGNECKYCYVKNARDKKFNAKIETDNCTYDNEILRMSKGMIDKLNKCGGIRLFSFSDYNPIHDSKLTKVLNDCLSVGLTVKVITKQVEFIDKYHDHDAINVIHISIDNINSGVDHKTAIEYRLKYNKVRLRSVILFDHDIDALDFADLHTLNHGNNGFKNYKKADRQALTDKGYKICCNSDNCLSCEIKCLSDVNH